jgi:hypothetical protein
VIADVSGEAPDLVVSNSNTVSVLLGIRRRSFRAKTDFPTGLCAMPGSVGDERGRSPSGGDKQVRGDPVRAAWNGGGGFAAKTDFAVGAAPASVAMGDLNRDFC